MTSLLGRVVLNEVVADNSAAGFQDQREASPDWIELRNLGNASVDLFDYYLTDDSGRLTEWKFTQSFIIPAGGYAIVFASNRNEFFEGEAHANFRLSSTNGEYLALIAPDGETIVDELLPQFPALKREQAYGRADDGMTLDFLTYATPGAKNSSAAERPQILSFTSSVESIAWGESATLSWEVEDTDTIRLELSQNGQGFELLRNLNSESGSIVVAPEVETSYRLIVSNELIDVTEFLGIKVGAGISSLSVKPRTLVPGGKTVIRWKTAGSSNLSVDDGFGPVTKYPLVYTPWNIQLFEKEGIWKSFTGDVPEGWKDPEFDDAGWTSESGPFLTTEDLSLRSSFQIDDLSKYRGITFRIAGQPDQIFINGHEIPVSSLPFPQSKDALSYTEVDLPPSFLEQGDNEIAVFIQEWKMNERVFDLSITSWVLQEDETTVPLELVTKNEAGEHREIVELQILQSEEDAPPLPGLVVSEFYWHYFGTAPSAAHRFIELHYREDGSLDLENSQVIGSAYVDFANAIPHVMEENSYALVVAHPETFQECWPGERPVIARFSRLDTDYEFDLDLSLLDPYGRKFESLEQRYPEDNIGFAVPRQRINEAALPLIPENFAPIHEYDHCGGSPGEANFRFRSFSFDPPVAYPGEKVTLRWEVSREGSLSINNVGPVTGPIGEYEFSMPREGHFLKRFIFNFEMAFGTVTYPLEIYPAAVIQEFKASPSLAEPGEEITFKWRTRGGNYPVTLSDDRGFSVEITASQFSHTPLDAQEGERRVYTLTMRDERGPISAQITVIFGEGRLDFEGWKKFYEFPVEDEDADSLGALLEYAIGSDPRSSTDFPLLIENDERGFLNLRYPENLAANGARLTLQYSSDLVAWRSEHSDFRLVGSALLPDSKISIKHHRSLIKGPLLNRYFRLLVELAE